MPALLTTIDYTTFLSFLMKQEVEAFYMRILATFFIFVVSLLAVSFPTLSKRISLLRIPSIVFFIGKHFGTGVILSTAFVHLLQDSFEALRSPLVLSRWKVGEYVGLIVLCSLLAIFVVEYVSTSFVDQLQSYSSPSTSVAPTPRDQSPPDLESARTSPKITTTEISGLEQTPILSPNSHHAPGGAPRSSNPSYGGVHHSPHTQVAGAGDDAAGFFEGHHRHESRHVHQTHHERSRPTTMYGPCAEEVTHTTVPHDFHHRHRHRHHVDGYEDDIKVGKKRELVGILVLQFGIMIHSLVIGLTLSITSGPDFSAFLLIAVIFHQLFEGLSLGIRIASLPSSQESEFKHLGILKPVLTCLFAITTPAGILLGILVFGRNDDLARMRLTQGIMSAISAGMLTYAACVEMLAGDFVMDPILWRSGVGKQALALFSLAAGVTAMALVGS
ncbi:zinc iron permease [Chiua virens]|nr:zinc iron permease [Chiua virens]